MELFCSRIHGVLRVVYLNLIRSIPIFVLVCSSSLATAQNSRIEGQLYWHAPDANGAAAGQINSYSGIPLEIFVHTLTSAAEIDTEDGVITKIYTPVIKRAFSKWNGTFRIKLPHGAYSVFVLYKNQYYGNLQDKDGNLSPAIVSRERRTWLTITINYSGYH